MALGWQERHIFRDAALDPLRGDPEFEAIVAQVKKKIGRGPYTPRDEAAKEHSTRTDEQSEIARCWYEFLCHLAS